MSRRKAIWAAVFLAVATLAVLFAVGRSRRETPAALDRPARPAVQPQLAAPQRAVALPAVTAAEKPLPAWVRVAVVSAALAAFFAVSLVARRSS
jgi:hypothetical protein